MHTYRFVFKLKGKSNTHFLDILAENKKEAIRKWNSSWKNQLSATLSDIIKVN